MKTKCTLFFVLWAHLLSGLTSRDSTFIKDSLLAVKYFNIADTSFMNVEKCKHYTLKAIPLLKKTEQWEKYIYCHNALSYCYGVLEEHDSLITNNEFTFQEAKKLLPKDHLLYVAAVNNLGYAYSKVKQDYRKASQHFKAALSLFPGEDSVSITAKASIYENLGFIAQREGDFDIAIAYFYEAINLQNTAFEKYIYKYSPNNFKVASNHHNIARVHYNQKQYELACQHLETAIGILDKHPNSDRNYYINYLALLTKSTLLKGDLSLSKQYLKRLKKEYAPLSSAQNARVFELEGMMALEKDRSAEAKQLFQLALEHTPTDNKVDQAELLLKLAKLNLWAGHYSEAEKSCNRAVNNLLVGEMDLETLLDSDFENVRSKALLAQALAQKGVLLHRWYNASQNDAKMLSSALQHFKAVTRINDQLRQEYQTEEAKLYLNDRTMKFYEVAIEAALELFELTQQEKYLANAYYYFERSRSVLLLEEIKKREASGLGLIPLELQDSLYQLRTEIKYYQRRLKHLDKLKKEEFTQLESIVFHLQERYGHVRDSIRQLYPEYTAFTNTEPVGLKTVQQELLARNDVILTFFTGEQKVFGLKVTPSKVLLTELGTREQLMELTNEVLDNMKLQHSKAFDLFLSASSALYEYLLIPLEIPEHTKLIILPNGILGHLPFELLLTTRATQVLPKELPFLLKKHTIKYAYSATILHTQSQHKSQLLKILGVVPVFENSDRYLSYSRNEAKVLKQYNAKILWGKQASVDVFKKEMTSVNAIHFSTHASAGDAHSDEPVIYFSDSSLTLSDLPFLRLNAEMVVLSACETSKGIQRTGEGAISLARGFTLSGVPAVLTTLWNISEQSAANITKSFYRTLAEGMTKDEALRQAKLDFLLTCEDYKSAPYYWAGFIFVGESAPVQLKQQSASVYWWLSLPALVILFFVIVRKK